MDNRTLRPCVRVIIIKKDKVLLGKKFIKGKFVCYEFPGGGVEEGDSFEFTVVNECLEEVGVSVVNPVRLDLSFSYEVKYPDPKRAALYKGGIDHWYYATYVMEDKRLFNVEGDALPYEWVSVKEAIRKIINGPESLYNAARIEALNKVATLLNVDTGSSRTIKKNW